MYLCTWIDVENPLHRHIYLILPHGAARRQNLAVDICQANAVIIDQIKLSDSAARQCLHCITADPADTEYCHPAVRQLFDSFFSD